MLVPGWILAFVSGASHTSSPSDSSPRPLQLRNAGMDQAGINTVHQRKVSLSLSLCLQNPIHHPARPPEISSPTAPLTTPNIPAPRRKPPRATPRCRKPRRAHPPSVRQDRFGLWVAVHGGKMLDHLTGDGSARRSRDNASVSTRHVFSVSESQRCRSLKKKKKSGVLRKPQGAKLMVLV